MPPPSNGMSDTLPPSIIAGVPEAEAGPEVARNPAPAALPVGTIERMGHTIQHLQSQNEVLPIQSKPLSASVVTMAAAAASATSTRASSSSTGPGVIVAGAATLRTAASAAYGFLPKSISNGVT